MFGALQPIRRVPRSIKRNEAHNRSEHLILDQSCVPTEFPMDCRQIATLCFAPDEGHVDVLQRLEGPTQRVRSRPEPLPLQ